MTFLRIGIVLVLFVAASYFLIYAVIDPVQSSCNLQRPMDADYVCTRYADLVLSLVVVVSALITLFGALSIEGAKADDGSYKEGRIRLSIALTVLVAYFVYFSLAVFWVEGTYNTQIFETLTNLMMVVIPFYFGSSAAVEWADKRKA